MNKCEDGVKNSNKIKANKKPVLTHTDACTHSHTHTQRQSLCKGKKKLQRCCQRRRSVAAIKRERERERAREEELQLPICYVKRQRESAKREWRERVRLGERA